MGLRHTFHSALATLTTTWPRSVVVGAVLLTAIAGRFALIPLQNIDTDILRQFPQDMPEVRAYREAVRDLGALEHLYGVIQVRGGEADVPLLIAAAEHLATAIDDAEFIFEVQWSLDPNTQDHYAETTGITHGLLLPAEQWSEVQHDLFRPQEIEREVIRLRHLLTSPLPSPIVRAAVGDPWRLDSTLQRHLLTTRGPVRFDPRSGHFLSTDSEMLLMVIQPLKPSTDLLFAQELMRHLRRAAEEVSDELDNRVTIGFLGPHAETLYDTSLLRQDVVSTAVASAICVLALFIVAFRRWSAVIFVGVPLAIGIIWALGLVGIFVGHLTIVTCTFAAIVLGVGIDFGIHFYNRFLEDRLQGNRTRQSVRTALVEVGPGVFTGALTTALAFFGLLLTDFPGFRELGVVGGTGVLCCLASMYLVAPALLMVLHHRRPRSRYRRLTSFGLDDLAGAMARRPRTAILTGLVITAWLGFTALRLEFDDDLLHLADQPPEQIALRLSVRNRFRLPGQPLLLTVSAGPDLQAALEANDALSRLLLENIENFNIASIDSLRTLLPSVKGQDRTREEIQSFDFERIRGELERAGGRLGLGPSALEPSLERLAAWLREVQEAPPLRLSLASRRSLRHLVTNYVTHAQDAYRVTTRIYPERTRWNIVNQAILINRLTGGLRRELGLSAGGASPLEVTGISALIDELRDLIKRDLALMVFVVTLGVFAVIWIHFRSFRWAMLVTVPVLTAVLWTLGLMATAGESLNFINVLALPIVIGLGIDNGVHILERYRGDSGGDIGVTLVRTGRAVVITSLSTILGFGALSLASFRGIRELGILAIVGVAMSLITSITLIPALIVTMGHRAGWRGLIRPDEG